MYRVNTQKIFTKHRPTVGCNHEVDRDQEVVVLVDRRQGAIAAPRYTRGCGACSTSLILLSLVVDSNQQGTIAESRGTRGCGMYHAH